MKSKKKGCLIAVVLFIVGLGAFAVFGFLPAMERYQRAAKAAEAVGTIRYIEMSVTSFYQKECKFPQNAVSSALPKDGVTVVPDFSKAGWKEIEMSSAPSVYFRYRMINEGETLKIVADTDFSTSTPEAHTVTKIMTAGPDCSVKSTPDKTTNEFE